MTEDQLYDRIEEARLALAKHPTHDKERLLLEDRLFRLKQLMDDLYGY